MFKKRFFHFLPGLFGLLLSFALVLSACSTTGTAAQGNPTAAVQPTESVVEMQPTTKVEPTAVPVETIVPTQEPMMNSNSLVVNPQALNEADQVIIADVVSDAPGWVAVYADDNGKPGKSIGYTAVPAGESKDVEVTIDPEAATEKLYATLHIDADKLGEFTFPGADEPALGANGQAVTMPFMMQTLPNHNAVQVEDQELGSNNTVVVAHVTSDGPGWIVIHADDGGKPGAVLGHAAVTPGDNQSILVPIDMSGHTPTLYAMLHRDAGKLGQFEFPGEDVPVHDAHDALIAPSFVVTLSNGVAANDQPLGEDGTVTIANVMSAQHGWLLVYADDNGAPGAVIGYTAVAAGNNADVKVSVDTTKATDKVYAMLHVDAGKMGEFEFPGPDEPLKGADENVFMAAFMITK